MSENFQLCLPAEELEFYFRLRIQQVLIDVRDAHRDIAQSHLLPVFASTVENFVSQAISNGVISEGRVGTFQLEQKRYHYSKFTFDNGFHVYSGSHQHMSDDWSTNEPHNYLQVKYRIREHFPEGEITSIQDGSGITNE